MSFNEFYETITEYETDHSNLLKSTLLDAWNAGALEMAKHLVNRCKLDPRIISEEVKEFLGSNL